MSRNAINLTEQVRDYLQATSLREEPILRQLREETAAHAGAGMQISPEQGQFMALLLKILNARRVIEVGVFTGYSSLCMALALPADGRVVACDVSEDYTKVARRYWREAGVAETVDLRLAPALETLETLVNEGGSRTYDFMFVDADKEEYLQYYEKGLQLIRPGGIIAVDNVLWGGSVADPDKLDNETEAIRQFNLHVLQDERVDISMLPVGDGLTLARKR